MVIRIFLLFLSVLPLKGNLEPITPELHLSNDIDIEVKTEFEKCEFDYYSYCIKELKRREGFSSIPYEDTDGKERYGFGTPVGKLNTVDTIQAELLLDSVFLEHVKLVKKSMADFCYTDQQYHALAMLSYNVGFYGFKYYKGEISGLYKQLIRSQNPKNWLLYVKVEGVPSTNLKFSRQIEYDLFCHKQSNASSRT